MTFYGKGLMLQAWRVEKVDMEQRAKELKPKKQEGKSRRE